VNKNTDCRFVEISVSLQSRDSRPKLRGSTLENDDENSSITDERGVEMDIKRKAKRKNRR